MVADERKKKPSFDLPRSINVLKFAESRGPELEALHAIVSSRTEGDFRVHRSKRRRTTSHDNQAWRNRSKRKRKIPGTTEPDCGDTKVADLPRRLRRRLDFKKNPESGFIVSGDGTRRLRTHIWYAKRFTMTKLWGFYLPLGLHGRGRGSRAILKRLRSGVLINDVSYHNAIQLEGSESSILSVVQMVLVPFHATLPVNVASSILSGAVFGTAMLHYADTAASPAIAPITYMWRPRKIEGGSHNCGNDKSENLQNEESSSSCRHFWIWLHVAAYEEGLTALNSACQKQVDNSGSRVSCIPLVGKLATLEVIGARASEILQKVMRPTALCSSLRSTVEGDNDKSLNTITSFTVKDPRTLSFELQASEGISPSDGSSLWDFGNVKPPIEEDALCIQKHKMRMESLYINDHKEKLKPKCDEIQRARYCPLLLLRNSSRVHSIPRWSVILPINWVKVFWNSFICNGAQAIGLREKQWISCELGLPSFPSDFPDCVAYYNYKTMVDQALELKLLKIPPSLRPLRVPSLSPWTAIYHSFQSLPPSNSPINSFPGYIARSPSIIVNYFNQLGVVCKQDETEFHSCFGKDTANFVIPSDHTLCFVRVALRAFKEGVFEEGAVVCAPNLDDISLSRSEDANGLETPESYVRSCFTQDIYDQWKFHVPEDAEMMKFHRNLIGFVTTGFARESKKPVAMAICDAISLARLREMQQPTQKGEIYVLVRNLRSTAYRLGVASVLIELHQNDAEFL